MLLSPSLLQPGQAHLFLARPEGLLQAAPQHGAWLSAEEGARAARYRSPDDGARYRATRILVRAVLSGLTGQAAQQLSFVELAHGRPALRQPTSALDFNASRSRGWLALLVTSGARCGVDVEDTRREADVLRIARAFAPAERASLLEASGEERRLRFFRLWTLKEATLKALGTGLTASLGACAFQLPAAGPPCVSFAPALHQDAADWRFVQRQADSNHLVAAAVRSAQPVDVTVHGDLETCAAVAALG